MRIRFATYALGRQDVAVYTAHVYWTISPDTGNTKKSKRLKFYESREGWREDDTSLPIDVVWFYSCLDRQFCVLAISILEK